MPRVWGGWPGKPRASRYGTPARSRGVYRGLISSPERLRTGKSRPIWAAYSSRQRTSAAARSDGAWSGDGVSMAIPSGTGGVGAAVGGEAGDHGGDLLQPAAGVEDPRHAGPEQHRLVLVGHDAAHHDADMPQPRLPQRLHQLGDQQVVGGQRADANDLHVLLDRELHHGADVLPRRRVDDLHAGVAEIPGHDAAAAVVAVE